MKRLAVVAIGGNSLIKDKRHQSVRDQYYATVRPMHLEHVEPSKRWADLIIPEGGNNHVALDLIIGKLRHVLAS